MVSKAYRTFGLGLLLLLSVSVVAQSGGDPPAGGTPPSNGGGDIDPIAIVAAHVAKGQTNNMQRRMIRTEWLTVAAQQAEDFLRSEVFGKIIGFVRENHELFESIYAGLKTANTVVSTGKRVESVIRLQRKLILEFVRTGDLVAQSETFTVDELRNFRGTLDGVIRDTEANFNLLVKVFRETTDSNITDMERYEILGTIEGRLVKNLAAVSQLNRYVTYLNTNRSSQMDSGLDDLLINSQ